VPSEYRFAQPLVIRFMGGYLAVVGVFVFVVALLVAVLHLPTAVMTAGVVLVVVCVLAAGLLLTRIATVVRLDDAGYWVRLIRGAGVRRARWTDVEDVVTSTVAGERCVVLRLRDGRTTTVPVRVLAGRPEDFVKDLRQHLDKGHGYRRIG
jgi:hypothetical protein